MINKNIPIYLASKSPRRKVLLKQLNLKFKVFSVECDESIKKNESFIKTVKRLSILKLNAAKKIHNDVIIITADTLVVLEKETIGKPKNKKEAVRILKKLSNTDFDTNWENNDADKIIFDNTVTGLSAIDIQSAMDEIIPEHTGQNDPHPQYVTPDDLPATLVGWFTDNTSAIDGAFLSMQTTDSVEVESSVAVSVPGADI